MHEVQLIHSLTIDDKDTARLGMQIDPPGERQGRRNSGSNRGRSHPRRRLVLADIARFEPSDDDPRETGTGDQIEIG